MRAALYGAAAAVLLFLLAPMLAVVILSFSPSELLALPPGGVSLRWYAELAASPRWRLAAWNSAVVGALATAAATTLGTLAALGLHFARVPGRAALLAVLTLPMVTPSVVTAAALFLAFSRIGLAGSLAGLVLAHTLVAAPFVLVSVLAALRGFDPALWRAATSLGAPPWTAFRRVLAPAIRPGIAAGAVFAFATSLDEFVITLFLAGPQQFTLPRQMYAAVREYLSPTILAAATLLFLCSLVALAASEAARRR